MTWRSTDPANGDIVATYEGHGPDEVDRRLDLAVKAYRGWRTTSLGERASLLHGAAELLDQDARRHGEVMAREMGKPIAQGVVEARKCAWALHHVAEHGPDHLAPQQRDTDGSRTHVRFDPLGPVLAVMPWNFPYWQTVRALGPALLAGNVGLVKPAPNTPACALALEEVLAEAGFPAGCFQNLFVEEDEVADLIRDPRVQAVTVTGSVAAGRSIAEVAGSAGKKAVLELGGSDPFIVLEGADVERAAKVGAQARCINSGQSCIAAKRFLVHETVHDAFVEAFTERMADLVLGDPMDEATDVGPQARKDLLTNLTRQVHASVDQGARVLLGGEPRKGPGWWFPPTVLADVSPDMPVMREEVFGPVAPVTSVADADEALRVANASPFGLGASVWTRDGEVGRRFVRELEAGMVFVNDLVRSDPRLPFGGVKASGHGRELDVFGLREFTNVKTVWWA